MCPPASSRTELQQACHRFTMIQQDVDHTRDRRLTLQCGLADTYEQNVPPPKKKNKKTIKKRKKRDKNYKKTFVNVELKKLTVIFR